MAEDSQRGPWALALGTLVIGVGAVVAAARRRRDETETQRESE